jgi:hypothetical protein
MSKRIQQIPLLFFFLKRVLKKSLPPHALSAGPARSALSQGVPG